MTRKSNLNLKKHEPKLRLILATRDITSVIAERLCVYFEEDLDRAFAMSADFVPNPEVHVFSTGAFILLVLED